MLNDNDEKFLKYILGRVHHALAEKDILNYDYSNKEDDNETDSKIITIRYTDSDGESDGETEDTD